MSERPREKRVDWIGSSLDDLKSFPDPVQQSFGFELFQAQWGDMPKSAKPLKGMHFNGVYELRNNYRGNTYRAVYIAKLGDRIYVLHCFQKKSKSGMATPKKELGLIKSRLKLAMEDAKGESK